MNEFFGSEVKWGLAAASLPFLFLLEILGIFDEMHAHGETILIVTHDPRIAERCERVVTIVDGRIEDDRRN